MISKNIYLKKQKQKLLCMKPYLNFHFEIIINCIYSKREISELMSEFENQPGNEIKWNIKFGIEQDSTNWQHILRFILQQVVLRANETSTY